MLSIPHPLGLLRLSLSNRVSSGLSLFCVFTGILWVQSFSLLVGFDFCCVGRIKTPLFFIECMFPSSSWSSGSLSLLLIFFIISWVNLKRKTLIFILTVPLNLLLCLLLHVHPFVSFVEPEDWQSFLRFLGFIRMFPFTFLILFFLFAIKWDEKWT